MVLTPIRGSRVKGLVWTILIAAGMLALLGWAIEPGKPTEAMPPAAESQDSAAVRVVEHFYSWYTNYLASPYSGPTRDPLADHAYRNSPDLAVEFVRKLDEIVASRANTESIDPVLFAQDVPHVLSARLESHTLDQARVVVRETWSGGFQDVVVTLRSVDGRWKIAGVERALSDNLSPDSPEHIVRVFYNWYVQYGRQIGSPLTDRIYRAAPLSQALLQRLDRIAEMAADIRVEDPVLLSSGIPVEYAIRADVVDSDSAQYAIIERFPDGTEQTVAVTLERENGRWVLARIVDGK